MFGFIIMYAIALLRPAFYLKKGPLSIFILCYFYYAHELHSQSILRCTRKLFTAMKEETYNVMNLALVDFGKMSNDVH